MQYFPPSIPLCDKSASSSALVSPGWWQNTDGLIVAGETVNTRFDENKTELRVLVLAVALKMLPDGDGLLDEHVQVFRNFRCKTGTLEDSKNLVTSDNANLSNSVRVTENNTNL